MSLRPERDKMNIGLYGLLIVFGAFVLLLIFNPNLSCFGKRVKSPLYPVLRRRSRNSRKMIKTEDYGFDLGGSRSGDHHRTEVKGSKTDSHQDEPSKPSGE